MATPMSAVQFMETFFGKLPELAIGTRINARQQAFLDFVLSHYVSEGVQELDRDKLPPLFKLKYGNAISDDISDLGDPEEIGNLFAGFHKYLYERTRVSQEPGA